LKAGGSEVEQAAETAEVGVRAGASGRSGEWLDGVDQRLARVDVDTGVAISQRKVWTIGGAYGVLRRAAV